MRDAIARMRLERVIALVLTIAFLVGAAYLGNGRGTPADVHRAPGDDTAVEASAP
jgi:hypothetical protein